VACFQPATEVAWKSLEHLGETIPCGLVVPQHDQAARPLQSRWLHLGRILQGRFVSGACLGPLSRLELGVALVERMGCGCIDFTNIVARLDFLDLGLWGLWRLWGVHQIDQNS
jgi:hypothetical protein